MGLDHAELGLEADADWGADPFRKGARARPANGARDMVESSAPSSPAPGRRNLGSVKLFAGLDGAERAALEQRCSWRRYRPGERLFERGSRGSEVYFVIEGAVNIVSFSPTGREITFATAAVGDTLGELAAIDGEPRSASVVAVEDSLLAILPAGPFIELLKRRSEISFRLLQRLSVMVRRDTERMIELSSLQATNRIYAELLRLAEPDAAQPDLWVVKPLPALRELAARASTTRELAARALNLLYPSGLISRRGDSLYIMDLAALEQIINAAQGAAPGAAQETANG